MKKRKQHSKRIERHCVNYRPHVLDWKRQDEGLWHESDKEVEYAVAWGKEKARLLKWVRRQMRLRLTLREQEYIALYYFRGLSYREAAKEANTQPSSIHRGVARGLRKLRRALECEQRKPGSRRPFGMSERFKKRRPNAEQSALNRNRRR